MCAKKNNSEKANERIKKKLEKAFGPQNNTKPGYGMSTDDSAIEKYDELHDRYSEPWKLTTSHRHILYTCVARKMRPAEIVEFMMDLYFDWPEIRRKGQAEYNKHEAKKNRYRAEAEILLERDSELKEITIIDGKKYNYFQIIQKVAEMGSIQPKDYGDRMVAWLRSEVKKCLNGELRELWNPWIEKETIYFEENPDNFPLLQKNWRIALVHRVIDRELARGNYADHMIVLKCLEYIKTEVEGKVTTFKLDIDELAETFITDGKTEDGWKRIRKKAAKIKSERLKSANPRN